MAAVLVGLFVLVVAVAVGERAWVLSHRTWDIGMLSSSGVDPSLVRKAAMANHHGHRVDGDCHEGPVGTMPWRLGSRLNFVPGPGLEQLPGSTGMLRRALLRAAGAFGARSGPCGRGPLRRWVHFAGGVRVPTSAFAATPQGSQCGPADGVSAVEVAAIPGEKVGMTCMHQRPDADGVLRVVEADIRLDADEAWVYRVGNCVAAFDVQSLLTHELGHVLGLSHAHSPTSKATMNRALTPCDVSARTLTTGDLEAVMDILL